MKRLTLGLLIIALLSFAAGCDTAGDEDNQDAFVTVEATGGGSVIQVLPGPSPFADSAASTIALFPPPVQERFMNNAEMGPFSNNTAEVSGDINITMRDAGASGDEVSGSAEFQTADGANWRFEFERVNPNGNPPHAPHFGGIVTDFVFHGPTALHTPLMVLVRSEASMWGFARVFRNGELLKEEAPFHLMLTTQARGEDFDYLCYECSTSNAMEQVHLVSRSPEGPLYEDLPGGFLHLAWQQSSFERTDP